MRPAECPSTGRTVGGGLEGNARADLGLFKEGTGRAPTSRMRLGPSRRRHGSGGRLATTIRPSLWLGWAGAPASLWLGSAWALPPLWLGRAMTRGMSRRGAVRGPEPIDGADDIDDATRGAEGVGVLPESGRRARRLREDERQAECGQLDDGRAGANESSATTCAVAVRAAGSLTTNGLRRLADEAWQLDWPPNPFDETTVEHEGSLAKSTSTREGCDACCCPEACCTRKGRVILSAAL